MDPGELFMDLWDFINGPQEGRSLIIKGLPVELLLDYSE